MRLIDTKDYGFIEGIYIFEDCLGDDIGAFINDDIFLEISGDVDRLFHGSLDNRISTCEGEFIDIEFDTLDLERGEKSVIDPTSQRVFVYWLPEVIIGIDIVISFWCSSETEMDGTSKVF